MVCVVGSRVAVGLGWGLLPSAWAPVGDSQEDPAP